MYITEAREAQDRKFGVHKKADQQITSTITSKIS